MRSMLITGCAGFLGGAAYPYFSARGYEVFGIDHRPCGLGNAVTSDVTVEAIRSFGVRFDVILHMAGSGTVGEATRSPLAEEQNTVGSTEAVLDYVAEYAPASRIVYPSSAAVYGDVADGSIPESTPLRPVSAYGRHKLLCEEIIRDASTRLGMHTRVIRFFSIYGEGLRKQLLWDFCTMIDTRRGESSLLCRGTGDEVRDWLHVSDALALCGRMAEDDGDPIVVNGGTGIGTSVRGVMETLCTHLGYGGRLEFSGIVSPGNPRSLVADVSVMKGYVGCQFLPLDEGIRRYVSWYLKVGRGRR